MHELAFRTEKNLLQMYEAELSGLAKSSLFSFDRFVFCKDRTDYLKEKIQQLKIRTQDENLYKARFLLESMQEGQVEDPLITKDFSDHLKEAYAITDFMDILELGEEWWMEVSSIWISIEEANKAFANFIKRFEDVLP